jgi:O-antigen ligase
MARLMASQPPGGGTGPLNRSPAWSGAPLVAVAMLIIIAVRLHEFVPGAHLVQPALLVTFGGLGLIWLKSPPQARTTVLRHPLVRMVFAYWLLMMVTIPFALWPGLAFQAVKYFLPGVALLTAILLCAPSRRTLYVLQLGMVASVAAYALYARTFGRLSGEGRLSAGMGMYDSNDMAAMLALTLPLAIGLARGRRGLMRWGLSGAALLLVAVVLASGSRGGLLGLSAGAIVLAFGMRGRRRIVAVALLAIVFSGMWTFSNSFRGRLQTLTNLEEDYNTFDEYGRKQVWERGRQYIRENPVIGVGAGNFPIAEGNYFGIRYSGVRGAKWSNAHNSYIQAYAELGVVGGTLFIAILLFGVRAGWRLWRGVRLRTGQLVHRPELLASLCAFLVSGTFLSHAYYMPMIAILAMIALADRQRIAEMRAVRLPSQGSSALPAPGGSSALAAPAGVIDSPMRTRRAPGVVRFRGGLA